jgi:iron complex outermembrane receptor protein
MGIAPMTRAGAPTVLVSWLLAQPFALAHADSMGQTGELQEVLITATKRPDRSSDVPLAASTFDSAEIDALGLGSVFDLQRFVPSLVATRGTQSANLRLTIRGVGAAGNAAIEPSVSTYVDDVYIPRPGALFIALQDLASIEVVRGPQGTLLGHNATAGAIVFHTTEPAPQRSLTADVTTGSYGLRRTALTADAPLDDQLCMRVALAHEESDGTVRNRLDGGRIGASRATTARTALRWQGPGTLEARIKLDYARLNGDGGADTEIDPTTLTPQSRAHLAPLLGANAPEFDTPFDRVSNVRNLGSLLDRQWGASGELTWTTPESWLLRLIGGYRDWRNQQFDSDSSLTPLDLLTRLGSYRSRSRSVEAQLVSPASAPWLGRIDTIVGAYYFRERYDVGENIGLGVDYCSIFIAVPARDLCLNDPNRSAVGPGAFLQFSRNTALYGQARLWLTESLDAEASARWTSDDKRMALNEQLLSPFGGSFRTNESTALALADSPLTYRFALSWKPDIHSLLFGSYSTGYKAGGFNSATTPVNLGPGRQFGPERIHQIEAGYKWRASDSAGLDVTLYRQWFRGLQDRASDGTSFRIINAGNLLLQGLELQTHAGIGRQLRIEASLALDDSRFTYFPRASCPPYAAQFVPNCTQDLTGQPANFAPHSQERVGLRWNQLVASGRYLLELAGDMSWMGAMRMGQYDGNPYSLEAGYSLLAARAQLTRAGASAWSITVDGENLMDTHYCTNRIAQPMDTQLNLRDPVSGGTVMRCMIGAPPTVTVSLRKTL